MPNASLGTPIFRGVYLNSISTIIGNSELENAVLAWVQAKNFNQIYLYDLNTICATSTGRANLRNFIAKSRTYGVAGVAGVGVSKTSMIGSAAYSRATYNSQITQNSEKLNIFNFENEFWNYNGADPYLLPGTNGQSRFNNSTVSDWESWNTEIFAYGNQNNIITDAYIGLIRDGKTSTPPSNLKVPVDTVVNHLVNYTDRILLAAYMTTAQFTQSTNSAYDRISANLQLIGTKAVQNNKIVNVVIMFHGGTEYMHSYFESNSFLTAYDVIRASFNNAAGIWKNGVNLIGYQVYAYQNVKDI